MDFLSAQTVNPARCLTGARACPPEDSGGPLGYIEMLAALAEANNEQHPMWKSWSKGRFDPEAFDPEGLIFHDPFARFRQGLGR